VRLEGLGKLKKFIHLMATRTRDLPACSKVPKPLCFRVPPFNLVEGESGCRAEYNEPLPMVASTEENSENFQLG
jgi:hypothetical protein